MAASAVPVAGLGATAYFNQRVTIAGHGVVNRSAALNQAAQAELASASSFLTPAGADFACYFMEPSDGFVYCGPVYFDLYETQVGYYRYPVSTRRSGGGVAVTVDMSSKVRGSLRSGTRLVAANGEVYTVGKDQDVSVAALADNGVEVAFGMWGGSAVWLLVSLVVGWRRRRAAARAPAPSPVWAQASWDEIGGLATMQPVTPSVEVFRPTPHKVESPTVSTQRPVTDGEVVQQELVVEAVAFLDSTAVAEPAVAVAATDLGAVEATDVSVGTGSAKEAPPVFRGDLDVGDLDGKAPWWSGPVVLAFGPVQVLGWTVEPDRKIVKDLAVYLAFHQDRPRSLVEVHADVWPLVRGKNGDRPKDVLLETARQSLSRLRRCVGEEHLPDASKAGGYALVGVASDWLRFQALIEAARRAPTDRAIKLRAQALGLVRGRPFAGIEETYYGWVFDELLISQMEKAIVDTAHELSEQYRADGQARLAGWAAGRGLSAVPTDEMLHADRMLAALDESGRPGFDRAWRDVKNVLGDQAESGPLGDLYRRITGDCDE